MLSHRCLRSRLQTRACGIFQRLPLEEESKKRHNISTSTMLRVLRVRLSPLYVLFLFLPVTAQRPSSPNNALCSSSAARHIVIGDTRQPMKLRLCLRRSGDYNIFAYYAMPAHAEYRRYYIYKRQNGLVAPGSRN